MIKVVKCVSYSEIINYSSSPLLLCLPSVKFKLYGITFHIIFFLKCILIVPVEQLVSCTGVFVEMRDQ